jgi:WD40 repeat protein
MYNNNRNQRELLNANNFSNYKIKKSNQNVNNELVVSFVVCNPKGEQPNIIVGFDNGIIKLFNFTASGILECTKILREHTDKINYISFNPINSNIFSSCSDDKSFILWNIMNKDNIQFKKRTFNGILGGYVQSTIFSNDGLLLCCCLSNDDGNTVRIIKLYKIMKRNNSNNSNNRNNSNSVSIRLSSTTFIDRGNTITTFCFNPNNNLLFVGIESINDASIIIFKLEFDTLIELSKIKCNGVFSSACNERFYIFVDTANSVMNVIDISRQALSYKYKLVKYFSEYADIIPLFHPRNPELFALYNFDNIIIFHISSSGIKCLYKYRHPNEISCASFNFSGNSIVFSSQNKLVILELKSNIVNNNSLNRRPKTMRMLGNIEISAH